MKKNKNNLIWIDLEMTGLNPNIHRIIEIATLITDNHLNILAEGPVISISQKKEHIFHMDQWNKKTHTKNGLIESVKNSTYNERTAELETIIFLKKWVPIHSSPICGNSIAQDRKFLLHYMPELENFFHYRNIDVSTVKELFYRWNTTILKKFQKKNIHRALADTYESVAELNFYKQYFLKF
ncbi:oligoribonuclease [Buchnera aphidicola (Macrosiphoniella sanborni)]|uniref:Oligoribonuclease n=1 Tax=Buchnera aphidicola (Macrosiphoniella sanborni) TaxID=1241865 RepID=A0A4D6YC56_9GAMM|nr:oligoribonuclease [Buchnera aphidicola]QCI24071.1 oligoribonuclease [Buchnera aphidicola (Macrosiphoniella sanborni)]